MKQMGWYTPVIPAYKSLRQEDHEFRLHSKTLSQKKERKEKHSTMA
jgi:hypothetical protein